MVTTLSPQRFILDYRFEQCGATIFQAIFKQYDKETAKIFRSKEGATRQRSLPFPPTEESGFTEDFWSFLSLHLSD